MRKAPQKRAGSDRFGSAAREIASKGARSTVPAERPFSTFTDDGTRLEPLKDAKPAAER
jgi:hypothetical protein